jgi:Ca2+-binding EF-hand superfamily protein
MDKNGNGQLEIDDIKGTYNASKHPDVIQRKKTEDEVLLEFLETFEQHHNISNNTTSDHIINADEWVEYYENISMSIDDDSYFELMMNNCWRMNNATTKNNEKKGWSNKEEEVKGNGNNLQQNYSANVKSKGARIEQQPSSQNGSQSQNQKKKDEDQVSETGNRNKAAENIIEKFRAKLNERGGKGIIGLQRQFKIFDDNNTKTLELPEFTKACKDFKVDLNQNEIKILFNAFDNDGSGCVDYNEFLREVRGEMNGYRKKITLQAFDKIDVDKSGVVDISEVKTLYNCKNHPDVKSGKKTEEEVYGEFIETFEMHHGTTKGRRDKRVTRDEFLEYYNNISSSIDLDEYFEVMMNNAWKLTSQPEYMKNQAWSNKEKENASPANFAKQRKRDFVTTTPWGTTDQKTSYETSNLARTLPGKNTDVQREEQAVDKFRNKLKARGTRGIMSVRRTFMIADDDGSKTLNFYELDKLCNDYRIGLTKQETQNLFKFFDTNNNSTVEYDEFLKGIMGEMNSFRKGMVKKAFTKLDRDNSGLVDIDDIRGVYSAKNHPDVLQGKKTEDEILGEFLDTFEYHFTLLVCIFK